MSSNCFSNFGFFSGANLQNRIIESDAAANPGIISYNSNTPPSNFDHTITVEAPTNILKTADLEVISLTSKEKIITGPKAEPKPAQA